MRQLLLHIAGLLFILLSISGCVGAGTVTGNPYVWDISDEGDFGLCPISYEKMIVGCPKSKIQEITPQKLFEIWGSPKSDKVTHGYREIVYDQKLAWRGLVIFVVIPIPLLIPLGHDEAKFLFKDEHLAHVEYMDNWLNAAVCGLHSEGPNGFGCISGWH
jgi:hypothetical protein